MSDEDPDDLEAIEASNDASDRQDAYEAEKAKYTSRDADELIASIQAKLTEQQALLSQLAMWRTFKKLTGVDETTVACFSYSSTDICSGYMPEFVKSEQYRKAMRTPVSWSRGHYRPRPQEAFPHTLYHTRYKTNDEIWHILPEPIRRPLELKDPP